MFDRISRTVARIWAWIFDVSSSNLRSLAVSCNFWSGARTCEIHKELSRRFIDEDGGSCFRRSKRGCVFIRQGRVQCSHILNPASLVLNMASEYPGPTVTASVLVAVQSYWISIQFCTSNHLSDAFPSLCSLFSWLFRLLELFGLMKRFARQLSLPLSSECFSIST
jgi:hypothetical protein